MSRIDPLKVTIFDAEGNVFAEHDLELPPDPPALVTIEHGEGDLDLSIRIYAGDLPEEPFRP